MVYAGYMYPLLLVRLQLQALFIKIVYASFFLPITGGGFLYRNKQTQLFYTSCYVSACVCVLYVITLPGCTWKGTIRPQVTYTTYVGIYTQ